MKKENKRIFNAGQVMILSILMLGGLILSAFAIAGLLTVYQVRQSNDFSNSAKAIFAADAAIEHRSYILLKLPEGEEEPPLQFTNGATAVSFHIFDEINRDYTIRSKGFAGKTVRALETILTREE